MVERQSERAGLSRADAARRSCRNRNDFRRHCTRMAILQVDVTRGQVKVRQGTAQQAVNAGEQVEVNDSILTSAV